MSGSLCETFRSLAFRTFDQLARARRVEHQPLEETFTDTNILDLKDRHPNEIYCQTFTKREEGINGADWEWWFTDATKSRFLGLRIQAKVLHLKTNTFPHLHYCNGKTYQIARFKRACAKDGLVPLYCFYIHHPELLKLQHCSSFTLIPEFYGCAIAPLAHIEALKNKGETNDLESVARGIWPWHCLVCCSGFGGVSLPDRAWHFLQHGLGIKAPRRRRVPAAEQSWRERDLGPRPLDRVPPYVHALLDRREPDSPPAGVRGVILIAGSGEN